MGQAGGEFADFVYSLTSYDFPRHIESAIASAIHAKATSVPQSIGVNQTQLLHGSREATTNYPFGYDLYFQYILPPDGLLFAATPGGGIDSVPVLHGTAFADASAAEEGVHQMEGSAGDDAPGSGEVPPTYRIAHNRTGLTGHAIGRVCIYACPPNRTNTSGWAVDDHGGWQGIDGYGDGDDHPTNASSNTSNACVDPLVDEPTECFHIDDAEAQLRPPGSGRVLDWPLLSSHDGGGEGDGESSGKSGGESPSLPSSPQLLLSGLRASSSFLAALAWAPKATGQLDLAWTSQVLDANISFNMSLHSIYAVVPNASANADGGSGGDGHYLVPQSVTWSADAVKVVRNQTNDGLVVLDITAGRIHAMCSQEGNESETLPILLFDFEHLLLNGNLLSRRRANRTDGQLGLNLNVTSVETSYTTVRLLAPKVEIGSLGKDLAKRIIVTGATHIMPAFNRFFARDDMTAWLPEELSAFMPQPEVATRHQACDTCPQEPPLNVTDHGYIEFRSACVCNDTSALLGSGDDGPPRRLFPQCHEQTCSLFEHGPSTTQSYIDLTSVDPPSADLALSVNLPSADLFSVDGAKNMSSPSLAAAMEPTADDARSEAPPLVPDVDAGSEPPPLPPDMGSGSPPPAPDMDADIILAALVLPQSAMKDAPLRFASKYKAWLVRTFDNYQFSCTDIGDQCGCREPGECQGRANNYPVCGCTRWSANFHDARKSLDIDDNSIKVNMYGKTKPAPACKDSRCQGGFRLRFSFDISTTMPVSLQTGVGVFGGWWCQGVKHPCSPEVTLSATGEFDASFDIANQINGSLRVVPRGNFPKGSFLSLQQATPQGCDWGACAFLDRASNQSLCPQWYLVS